MSDLVISLSPFLQGVAQVAHMLPRDILIVEDAGVIVYMNNRLTGRCGNFVGRSVHEKLEPDCHLNPFYMLSELLQVKNSSSNSTIKSNTCNQGINYNLIQLHSPEDKKYSFVIVGFPDEEQNCEELVGILPCYLHSARASINAKLAAGVVHDANNHFGGVSQSAQVLRDILDFSNPRTLTNLERMSIKGEQLENIKRYAEDRQLSEFVEVISDSSQKAFDTVNSFLDTLRAVNIEIARCDMPDTVNRALYLAQFEKDLKDLYGFRSLEIEKKFSPDIPRVFCDGRYLILALLFLIKKSCMDMARQKLEQEDYVPKLSFASKDLAGDQALLIMRDNCSGSFEDGDMEKLMDSARFIVENIHRSKMYVKNSKTGRKVEISLTKAIL